MINNSIENRLPISAYSDYILFLLDAKTETGNTRISQKRIQTFCSIESNKREIEAITKESMKNNLKISQREFNLFKSQAYTVNSLKEDFKKDDFSKIIGNRVAKLKHRVLNDEISLILKICFINDLHYVINHEADDSSLSETYIRQFEDRNMISTNKAIKPLVDVENDKPFVDLTVQRYKFFFRNLYEKENSKDKFSFFLNLYSKEFSLTDKDDEYNYYYIPIMKEVNTGLNVALRIEYALEGEAKSKAFVITQSLDPDTLDTDIINNDVVIDFIVSQTNIKNKSFVFTNYDDIEGHIERQIRHYAETIKENLNHYNKMLYKSLPEMLQEYFKYFSNNEIIEKSLNTKKLKNYELLKGVDR